MNHSSPSIDLMAKWISYGTIVAETTIARESGRKVILAVAGTRNGLRLGGSQATGRRGNASDSTSQTTMDGRLGPRGRRRPEIAVPPLATGEAFDPGLGLAQGRQSTLELHLQRLLQGVIELFICG